MASCLDDENEIPLKVIASFSASRFALPSIPLQFLCQEHEVMREVDANETILANSGLRLTELSWGYPS